MAANGRALYRCIVAGAGFFILALLLSALYDPRIRVLHLLQALIYVAVIVLARQRSAWGYGAGFLIAVMWNYTNLFVSTFVRAGWGQFVGLVQTGHLRRPDLLIALLAAGSHFLLMAACLLGLLSLRPGGRELGKFLAGGIMAVASFVLMITTVGRQYVPLLRRVFRV